MKTILKPSIWSHFGSLHGGEYFTGWAGMLVGGLIARKNAAKLQGGIKNCGLLVLWLLKGVLGEGSFCRYLWYARSFRCFRMA